MSNRVLRVIFVCTGNSARSQIAEALLTTIGTGRFYVASAGTAPQGVNPLTIRVLANHGIDWSRATSKGIKRFVDEPWDYVITVCDNAKQACPIFPGEGERLHWGLEDPAAVTGDEAARLAAFEKTYEELRDRVQLLVSGSGLPTADR